MIKLKEKINKMNLKQRITWAMRMMSGFLVLVGLIGVIGMYFINRNTKDMYENNFVSTMLIRDVRNNMNSIYTNVMLSTDEKNKNQVNQYIVQIDKWAEEDNKWLEQYEGTISSDEERTVYKDFSKLIPEYRNIRKELLKAALNGNKEEVNKQFVLFTEMKGKVDPLIDKIVKINKEGAAKTDKDNLLIFYILFGLMFVFMIGTTVTSVIVGNRLSERLGFRLNKLKDFVKGIGEGNFKDYVTITAEDELAEVGRSLNQAITNVADMIKSIQANAESMSANSEQLSATIEEITSKMNTVSESTQQIAQGNEELNATTEEINASATEVLGIVNNLKDAADNSSNMAVEILERATKVKENGEKSFKNTDSMYKDIKTEVDKVIEESKVINDITEMAEVISKIADQTNLLSLNAMIEATKAGEQGKGFTVVAQEVRKLSEESTRAVESIKATIKKVQSVTNNLIKNINNVVEFIGTDVEKEFEELVKSGELYQEDSQSVREISETVLNTSTTINTSMNEISQALQSISAMGQQTSASSEEINGSIQETAQALEEIARSAQMQAHTSEDLAKLISKFRI